MADVKSISELDAYTLHNTRTYIFFWGRAHLSFENSSATQIAREEKKDAHICLIDFGRSDKGGGFRCCVDTIHLFHFASYSPILVRSIHHRISM